MSFTEGEAVREEEKMFIYERVSRMALVVCCLCLALVPTDITAAAASGYQGTVLERRSDGGIGAAISGVHITFAHTNGRVTRGVTTDSGGRYRVQLARGAYRVTAKHPDYDDYSSAPGFFVVTGTGYQTGNIFLKRSMATTVLLIRHAEKGTTPPQDPPLNPSGQARANELLHVAQKAGVKAIYATNALRSRQTVQPLSTQLNVPITTYPAVDFQGLKGMIMSAHTGDVVLVAGHSDTMESIIQALGGTGQSCSLQGDEFDNLCVVTIYGSGKVNVINLQYGSASP